jgi:signal transduction histidine kinase
METGFGLKNMVKRAHVANASLELISAPGEGTAIIIEF